MRDVKDIIEFYRSEKISDHSFKMEIGRALSPLSRLNVEVDTGTSAGTTNSSYVAMVVPEKINGELYSTLVIDRNAIMNILTIDDIDFVLKTSENFTTYAVKMLNNFIVTRAGTEVSYSECILTYLHIYKALCEKFAAYPALKDLMISKTIDLEKLQEVELAIETKNEKSESVVEFILIHKLLPEIALKKAEELFQHINVAGSFSSETEADGKPVQNYWYSKAAALSNGIINPEYHQDLDPFYNPQK